MEWLKDVKSISTEDVQDALLRRFIKTQKRAAPVLFMVIIFLRGSIILILFSCCSLLGGPEDEEYDGSKAIPPCAWVLVWLVKCTRGADAETVFPKRNMLLALERAPHCGRWGTVFISANKARCLSYRPEDQRMTGPVVAKGPDSGRTQRTTRTIWTARTTHGLLVLVFAHRCKPL